MESRILLGKILQRFSDSKVAKVDGYNTFGYLRETSTAVYVSREKGKDSRVSFANIIAGIEAYQSNSSLYHGTPVDLRKFGITHVTSPVWSLLHLLSIQDYQ